MAPAGISYFSNSRPLGSNSEISPLRVSTTSLPSELRTTFMRVNFTWPAKDSATGPSLTATLPL